MTAADKPSPIPDTYRRVTPSLVVQGVTGPASALREVEALAADLSDYHLFHATRAELLGDLGHTDQAQAADARALTLTDNPAQRSLLRQRLNWT
jgi:predicted RNA polymerase sigma factor